MMWHHLLNHFMMAERICHNLIQGHSNPEEVLGSRLSQYAQRISRENLRVTGQIIQEIIIFQGLSSLQLELTQRSCPVPQLPGGSAPG